MAFVALLPGLSRGRLPLGMLPAKQRFCFRSGLHRCTELFCSRWTCRFAPASLAEPTRLPSTLHRAPLSSLLSEPATRPTPAPASRGEGPELAAGAQSSPSHQQRWFGILKAKVDFSFRKRIARNPARPPPPSLTLGFCGSAFGEAPAPRHLAPPCVHAAFRHVPLPLPGCFSCRHRTPRGCPSAPNTGAFPAASLR